MKRHSLALPVSERWEYPEDAYSRLDFASPPYISSSLGVARPFTNKVEKGWKKCTDPMVGGARSITLYDACTPSPGGHLVELEKCVIAVTGLVRESTGGTDLILILLNLNHIQSKLKMSQVKTHLRGGGEGGNIAISPTPFCQVIPPYKCIND